MIVFPDTKWLSCDDMYSPTIAARQATGHKDNQRVGTIRQTSSRTMLSIGSGTFVDLRSNPQSFCYPALMDYVRGELPC